LADRLFDPAPWLQGDALDAAMEYRWYEPGREFFGGAAGATPPAYAAALEALDAGLPRPAIEARMNVASSHDTPRLLTALANTGRDEFEAASPRENPEYSVARPDADTRARARLLRLAQFTWAGAPHIWYGEEAGMWGADDPDCRKPMLWEDLEYDDEAADPPGRAPADEAADSLGDARVPEPIAPGDDDDVEAADPLDGARVPEPVPPVAPDLEHLAFVRQLVALRKAESDLFAAGEVTFLTPAFRNDVFVYSRALGEREAIVVLNRSSIATQVLVPVRGEFPFRDPLGPPALRWPIGGKVLVTLAGLEGKLLLNDPAHEAPPTDAAPETRRGFPLRSTHAQP
jgi:glycosidase